MMRPQILSILMIVFVLFAAGAAFAQFSGGQIGNLNPPIAQSVPDILTGSQSFAYLVFPDEQVTCTQNGFKLDSVSMILDFTPSQIPAVVEVQGGLAQAVWDPTGQYLVPGGPICNAPPSTYVVNDPGLFDVEVPMNASCGCYNYDAPYFLVVSYSSPFEANLPVDGLPQPQIVFMNDGSGNGWQDMFGLKRTSSGKVIIWGDLTCCAPPVGNEASAWGAVKGLFK